MKRWLPAVLLLVLSAGCASSNGPAAIDGKVDIVHATPGDAALTAEAGKSLSTKDCAARVKASNALLDRRVVALFRPADLRQVEHLTPADTFNCRASEGPDFGGVSALWRNTTGAHAIDVFTADGWTRTDPAGGPPAWATQRLPHGDGSLNLEPGDQFVVTFRVARAGRHLWAELTQDGLRAGLDDAA